MRKTFFEAYTRRILAWRRKKRSSLVSRKLLSLKKYLDTLRLKFYGEAGVGAGESRLLPS